MSFKDAVRWGVINVEINPEQTRVTAVEIRGNYRIKIDYCPFCAASLGKLSVDTPEVHMKLE